MDASAKEPGSRLPADRTSFVGRRHERAEIRRLLTTSRLLTVTGFGGIGKTRLALRVSADARRAFSSGVWFVSLAELRDSEAVADGVAMQLGMPGHSEQTVRGALINLIGDRQILLVLDNCEHLVDACAVLADMLLRACPHLRILATSRQPLRIGGETVFSLSPLSVPPGDGDLAQTPLVQYEAIRLFVDRAQSVLPYFTLTAANRGAVAGICRYLEGIPLALELAAVRLRALSPGEILDRLSNQWQLLTVGDRAAPRRQQTLRACIEWSYELCSDEERDMWARVSVFEGGFEMDAVDRLYGAEDAGATLEHLVDLVTELADKSILIRSDEGGRVRHRMLETIRSHGLDELSRTGRLAAIRRQHRILCSDMTDRANAEWLTPRQADWMAKLSREESNLQAALAFCAEEPGEAEAGMRIGTNMHSYTIAMGRFRPGRVWFERLLACPGAPSQVRVSAVRTAAWLAICQGDVAAGTELVDKGRQLARRLGEPTRAFVDQASGLLAMFVGDFERAIVELERASTIFDRCGERTMHAETTDILGMAYGFAGQNDRALACHRQCLELTEAAGETWFRAMSLWSYGLVIMASGDIAEATRVETASLRLRTAIGDHFGVALCLDALAWTGADSDACRSAALLGAADALWMTIGTSARALPGLAVRRDKCEQSVRTVLGDATFSEHHQRGFTMDRASVVQYALDEETPRHVARPRCSVATLSVLTKRERQIATLVARGMTNRDIAAELVIAVRTAETHVERILAKLGFTSRVQVANWVTEQHQQA